MSVEKPVFLVTTPIIRNDVDGVPVKTGVEGEVFFKPLGVKEIEDFEKNGLQVSEFNLVQIPGTKGYK